MKRILNTIAWILIIIGILLSTIFFVSFNKNFYKYEYHKYQQAENIGMSEEDLMNSTHTLLDYIKGDRDDIVVEAEVNGITQEVFNKRETLHMVDVKNLYQGASVWRYIFLISGILLLVINRKEDLLYSYKRALIYVSIFLAFISIYAVSDFDGFWVNFHYLFFDNDLFFLDPNTSIMINMFPSNFFFELVALIIVILLVILFGIYFILRRKK